MADIAILEGFLKHRDGRKWKQRWCVLKRSSPIADRLSMTLYKDRADKNKDGKEKATHSLEDFCGIESGLVVEGVSNVMAIVCQQRVLLLAFESREKMLVWELKIRSTIGEAWRFPVVIPSGSKFPTGPAMLHFYSNYFCLTHGVPPKLLWCWQLQGIRRYGAIAGGFSFEAGSKCGKGSGLFYIHTEEADSLQMLFNCVASGVPPPRMDLRGSLSHHPSTESVASEGIYTRYLGCSEDSLSLSSASSGASYGHATELASDGSSPVLRRNFSRKSYEDRHRDQDSTRSTSSSPKHLYDTPNKAKELYDTPRMHHAEIGIVRPMSQSQDVDQPFAMSSEEDLPLKVDSRSQSVGAVNYDVPKNLTKLAEKIPAVPSQGQDDQSHKRDTISSSDYMELGSDGASSLSDMKSLTDSAIDTASFSTDPDKRKSPDPDTADEVFECSDGTLKKEDSDGEEDTSECGDMDEDLDKIKQGDEKEQRITSPASPVPSSESGRGSQYEMMTPPGSVTGDSAITEEEAMIGTYGTMAGQENQGHVRQHSLKAYLQMKPMRSHSIGGAVGRKDGPEQWYQVPRELCSPTVGRRGQGRPLSRASSDETSSSSSPKSVPKEGLAQEPLYQVPRKLCSLGPEDTTGEDIYDNVAMKRWQLLKERVLKEQEAEKEAEESVQLAAQSQGGPISSYEDMQPAMEKEPAMQERPKGAEGVHVGESYEAMEPRSISKNVPVMPESYESMVPGQKHKQHPAKGVEEEEGPQYENLPFWQQQKQQQLAMEGQAEKSPINYEMMDIQFDEMPMADTYGAILGKTPVVEETYQVCPKGALGGMSYEDMQPSILKKDPFCLLTTPPSSMSSSGDSSKEFFTLPGRKVSHDSETTDKYKTLKTFKGVPSPSLKRKVLPKELQGEYENVAGLIRGTQGMNIPQSKGNGYEVMEVSNKGKTEIPSSDIPADIYQNVSSLTTSYKEAQKSTLKDIPVKEQYELMATLKEMEDYEKSHNSKGQKPTGGNSKKRGAYMDMAQKVQKSPGKPRLQQLQGDLDEILSGETDTDPSSPKLTRASSAPTKRITVKEAAQMYEVMTPNQSAEASQYRERCHTDPASPKPRSFKVTDSSFNYEVMNPEVTHAGEVLQRRHTDPPSGNQEKCTKEDVSQFPLKGSGKKKKHESSACTIERPRHGKSYGKVNRGKILKGGISESESESSGSQVSINTESGTKSPPTSPSHNPTAAQRLDIARSMAGSSSALHSYMNIQPVSESEPTYMNLPPSSHQHSPIVPEANYMNIPKSTEHIRKQLNYLSLDVHSMGGGTSGERDPTAYAEIDVTATQSAHKAGLQHYHSRKELLKDNSNI